MGITGVIGGSIIPIIPIIPIQQHTKGDSLFGGYLPTFCANGQSCKMVLK